MPRVLDAWDDEETDDFSRPSTTSADSSASNARLWQIANNSLSLGPSATGSIQAGQSSYIYNGSSSSSSPSGIPPPQAFMPSLKILKRPSSATGNKGSTSPNSEAAAAAAAKTMRDREKAYKEARTRIFGEEKAAAKSSAATSSAENSESEIAIKRPGSAARGQMNSNKATSATTLVREPVNPPSATAQSAGGNKTAKDLQREKGFNTARRSKPKKALSAAAMEFKPVTRNSHSPPPAPASVPQDLDDKMQELKV